jgi:hypothetical protein
MPSQLLQRVPSPQTAGGLQELEFMEMAAKKEEEDALRAKEEKERRSTPNTLNPQPSARSPPPAGEKHDL